MDGLPLGTNISDERAVFVFVVDLDSNVCVCVCVCVCVVNTVRTVNLTYICLYICHTLLQIISMRMCNGTVLSSVHHETEQDIQCTCNVTWKCIRVTIVAVEKQ